MTTFRAIGLVSAVVAISVATALLLWPDGNNSDVPTTTPGPASGKEQQNTDAPVVSANNANLRTQVGLADLGLLRICSQADDSPLKAILIPTPLASVRTLLTDDTSRAVRSDNEGQVQVAELAQSDYWVVLVPGFISCIISKPKPGQDIRLEKASPLRVQVTGEDANPVGGVAVALQPRRAASPLPEPSRQDPGVGDPRNPSPVWVGRTDGKGLCTFDSLPRGAYVMRVSHPFSYARTTAGSRQEPVYAPGSVFVDMLDLYAVCVEAPPKRAILTYAWTLPSNRELSVPLQAGRDGARHHLAKAFPNALVYVGRPSPDAIRRAKPALVECKAILDDHMAAEVKWPLTKVREIEDPVFLEPKEGIVVRSVTIRVLDKFGESLPMMLRLGNREVGIGLSAKTSTPLLLRVGRYTVTPFNAARWVSDEFEKARIEVKESDPMSVERTIRLSGAHRLVVLEPKWGTQQFEGFLHVALKSKAGGYVVMNWTPARGPIDILFPLGPGSYRTQCLGFEPVSHSFVVDRGTGPMRLEIPLTKVSPPQVGAKQKDGK